ncbi:hypothetical protein, partial [Nocardia neocaledoniensis]|uniref:hypothetical protein n=1 Tax=Nocardia neocaledoniensis TaxID=236511 RepID=UPI002454A041
ASSAATGPACAGARRKSIYRVAIRFCVLSTPGPDISAAGLSASGAVPTGRNAVSPPVRGGGWGLPGPPPLVCAPRTSVRVTVSRRSAAALT